MSELKTVPSLRPFTEVNPYKGELQKAKELMESFQGGSKEESAAQNITIEKALETIHTLDQEMEALTEKKKRSRQNVSSLSHRWTISFHLPT